MRRDGRHRQAAMEPRPDGRGKVPPVMLACPFAVAPQWSPGLMAGGSRAKQLIHHTPPRRPQWSPGLMAGGRPRRGMSPCSAAHAAMEPRPDGRGKASKQGGPGDSMLNAAMEPRPDGRGKFENALIPVGPRRAAMEPRPDGRGKRATTTRDRARRDRRNGAPA